MNPVSARFPAPLVPAGSGVEPVVRLRGVGRRFGEVEALSGLDLEVEPNRITVLLGPNGAGKTTAIRMITGALEPHEGSVETFGLDPGIHGEEVRGRCGGVSAKPALYDRLDGWSNLTYSAELYGLGRGDDIRDRIAEAAARFGIDHALDQRVGGFSTGMKTRLALARSILHDPDLLLFDEPTSGLDPESSHAVLEMIREMTDAGRTVVMCTHLLLEAEGLADKVVVMEGGHDLVAGTPIDLVKSFWPSPVLRVGVVDGSRMEGSDLGAIPGVVGVEADHDPRVRRLHLEHEDRVPGVIAALVAAGIELTRAEPITPTLEDLYFAVRSTGALADDGGRQLRPDETTVTDRHHQVARLTGWPGGDTGGSR